MKTRHLGSPAVKDRPDVRVFTKVAPFSPPGSGYGRKGVRAGVQGSPCRLGRDVIDLDQLHPPG